MVIYQFAMSQKCSARVTIDGYGPLLDRLGITVFRQNRPVFDKNRLKSSNSPRARFFRARGKCRENAPKLHFSNMPRLPAMVFGTLRRNGKATENVKKMRVFAIPNEK